ncbi:hypothetical protein [Modicisalibacter coralii]|nr:hypothetical protein [Halomonas coralii]
MPLPNTAWGITKILLLAVVVVPYRYVRDKITAAARWIERKWRKVR